MAPVDGVAAVMDIDYLSPVLSTNGRLFGCITRKGLIENNFAAEEIC
jgi:hypothetical protein